MLKVKFNKNMPADFKIVNGNRDVKGYTFNILCYRHLNNTRCSYCYNKKFCYLYPNALPCWKRHLNATLKDDFVKKFFTKLKRKKKFKDKYLRVHSEGEIYSIEYFLKLCEIARLMPDWHFATYTKEKIPLRLLHKKPKNLIINWSHPKLESGNIDHIKCPRGYDNIVIVHETMNTCLKMKDKSKKCIRDCKACYKAGNKQIVIKKH